MKINQKAAKRTADISQYGNLQLEYKTIDGRKGYDLETDKLTQH